MKKIIRKIVSLAFTLLIITSMILPFTIESMAASGKVTVYVPTSATIKSVRNGTKSTETYKIKYNKKGLPTTIYEPDGVKFVFKYNKKGFLAKTNRSTNTGAWTKIKVNKDGFPIKLSYYDNFKAEQDCKAFRGLHSKCYGVVTEHGLELTIAGVPAKTLTGLDEYGKPVYLTREQELQGNIKDPVKALDLLTNDYTFHVNTGITACYIGAVGGIDGIRKPTILNINGHEISTAGGCVLKRLNEKKVKDTEFDYGYEFLDINLYR